MGTLNEKLEYLSQTKEYIKEAIISKGQPVSSSDTFRSYASKIAAIENGDVITATNTTGSVVSADDRVWVEPVNGDVENFTKVGTVAITDKVAQSLDTDNYISLPNINFGNNTWEYQTAIYFTTITSGSKCVLSNPFQINTQFNSTSIFLLLSSNGTSWDINDVNNAANFQIPSQTKYYIKVIFDGSKYLLQTSVDGSSWTTRITVNNSTKIFNSLEDIAIGKSSNVIDYLYLEDTYIKVDGNIVWTPYKEAVVGYSIIPSKSVSSTSFTAIAQANIANNTSGSVKTILDGNGTYAPTLGTKVITRNNTYSASTDDLYGYSSVTVNVEDIPAVVESLSITPTTSAQSFTPTSGVDGYSPVTVSAVDSSIDANITAGNIKSGVEILGVEGTYSGETPVLQDKVILSNGEYTADEGYDGIGTATVAVNATGATEVATNRTGAAISNGDKIWVNQEYYEAGDSFETNTIWNGSGQRAYLCSYNSYSHSSYTSFKDLTGNTLWTSSAYGSILHGIGYDYIYGNGYVTKVVNNLNIWTIGGNTYPVIGSDKFLVTPYVYGNNSYIYEINPDTGETIESYPIVVQSYGSTALVGDAGIIYLGDYKFMVNMRSSGYSINYCGILTIDPVNKTSTFASKSIFPDGRGGYLKGLTSDNQFAIVIPTYAIDNYTRFPIYTIDVSNPDNPSRVTKLPASTNYPKAVSYVNYQPTSDMLTVFDIENTDYEHSSIISYDKIEKSFSIVANDFDKFGVVQDVYYDSNKIPLSCLYYDTSYGNLISSDKLHSVILNRILGNQIVDKLLFNTTTGVTGTAAENIALGASGNVYLGDKGALQSKAATSNGIVTPSEGYYGLSKVTVNVVGTGVEVEAKNYTGANISEGDKVWINPYVIEPENPVAVPPFNSNQNYATFVPDEDGLYYWLTGNYTHSGYYRTSDNSQIASISENTTYRFPIMFKDGTRYQCYATSYMSLFKASKGTYWNSGYVPICNNPDYVLDSTNHLLCRINHETGEYISSIPINVNSEFFSNNPHAWGGVLLDDTHLLIAYCGYYLMGLFTLTNGTFENTIWFDINYDYTGRKFTGLTSDGKYVITNTKYFLDISNILTNGTISWKALSDFNIPVNNNYYHRFNQNGDYLEVLYPFGYDENYPYLLYKYDTTTKIFNQIAIDTDMSGHWVVATAGNNTIQVYQGPNPGTSTNKGYIATSVAIDGTQLVQYKTGNITQNTQTGIALQNIAAGSTGSVKVGAKITPTGSTTITENGTYDITDYAEAVINVSDVPAVVESLSITPSTSQQTFTPTSGVDGYAPVTVSAVDSTIDQNIVAGNIKKDVTILGVTGTLESANIQTLKTRTIESTDTLPVAIIPSSGYDGMAEVNIVAIENLSAENIKKDIEIAGVTGTYEGTVINNQDISITTDGVYTAEQEYTGLGTVTVTAGSVSEQKAYNEMAERLMLINDGEVTFTLTVSPTTASVVLTSVTNSTDITPTSSSSGVYEYPISADSTKNYNYTVSAEGYTTQSGTVVGGTTTATVTLVAENDSGSGGSSGEVETSDSNSGSGSIPLDPDGPGGGAL